eukprot:scaffold19925_cov122-Amphora_coffeaeformis.AAC.1
MMNAFMMFSVCPQYGMVGRLIVTTACIVHVFPSNRRHVERERDPELEVAVGINEILALASTREKGLRRRSKREVHI